MKNTLMLKTKDIKEDIKDIEKAAEILKNGGVVAIPTETVYGLAADAFNGEAVKKIFEAKGRPQDNPLIVHISDFEQIYKIAREVPESAKKLCEKFWPGPLTIILPKRDQVPKETSGGLDTVAVRMPSNKIANKIISLSCPLAAPSANISGFPSPTSFSHVECDMMGRADAICDGGDCDVGVESTVITLAVNPPVLLRPGGITLSELREVLGEVKVAEAVLNPMKKGEVAASPGMKYKHYSPKADITIVRGNLYEFKKYSEKNPDFDGILCFEGEEKYFKDKITVTMGSEKDSLSQAHRLFDALRELDEKGAKKVLSRSPSKEDVGLAVCNRLYRAAAFKIENGITRPVVGLTGPTGAGKGYVGEYLKKKGCYVCDTDKIAREITVPGSPFLDKLKEVFGEDIINTDGSLNRKLLAQRAFKDRQSQEKLNKLTHPEILRISFERCQNALDEGAAVAVIDAPLLFESGGDKLCDTVISVTAPESLRLQRITGRDNLTLKAAKERMSVQQNDEFYTEKSEFCVISDGQRDIEEQLKPFFKKYIKEQVL